MWEKSVWIPLMTWSLLPTEVVPYRGWEKTSSTTYCCVNSGNFSELLVGIKIVPSFLEKGMKWTKAHNKCSINISYHCYYLWGSLFQLKQLKKKKSSLHSTNTCLPVASPDELLATTPPPLQPWEGGRQQPHLQAADSLGLPMEAKVPCLHPFLDPVLFCLHPRYKY